jgi:phosphoheptose isomerase
MTTAIISQVEVLANEGDIVIGIGAGGSSDNVIST